MYKYVLYIFEINHYYSILEQLRMQKPLARLITLRYSGSSNNPYLWYKYTKLCQSYLYSIFTINASEHYIQL